MRTERVTFLTEDGVTIVGLYTAGTEGGPAALLLHMMPATKESWAAFTDGLVAAGFGHVLAIDLRGHGESTAGPGGEVLDYRLFEDADHQAMAVDVEAAAAWLVREHGAELGRLLMAGASIGANLAIGFGAAHTEVPAVIALSPGLDYRGVTTTDKVAAYAPEQRLYLAASSEDQLSYMTDKGLADLRREGTVLKEFDGAGHGTAMFDAAPGFLEELVAWSAGVMAGAK